jgi:hypothetical protein
MEKSLLHISSEEAQENEARRLKAESALDKAEALIEIWFNGYSKGEMTFEGYCKSVFKALSVNNIEPHVRQKRLGGAVESALKADPTKRTRNSKRSNPEEFVQTCHDLVKLVRKHENLSINREGSRKPKANQYANNDSEKTAFMRVEEILRSIGVAVHSSTVEKNYRDWKKIKKAEASILPKAGLAMVYGESGAGKTFFVFDMVATIARGVDWRGRKVKKGRVIYVAAEGVGGFRKRLNAYASHHEISLNELDVGIIDDAPIPYTTCADVWRGHHHSASFQLMRPCRECHP